MANTQKITLGSGHIYIMEYDSTQGIPTDDVLEVEDNLLGHIQGGAVLKYEPEFYNVSCDCGEVKQTFLTKESVTLSSGVLTWNANTLGRICSTARVTEDALTGKRSVKIGGLTNYVDKTYVIRFKHLNNGTKTTIVGNNTTGFEFAYAPDKETVVNVEFTAKSMDTEGTLVEFTETIE